MRTGAGQWALGGVVSVIVHLGAGAGLLAALQPHPIEDQPTPESRLNIAAQDVPRSTAEERAPDATEAAESDAQAPQLDAGAIAQSQAAAMAVPVTPTAQQALDTVTAAVKPESSAQPVTAAALPQSAAVAATQPIAAPISEAPVQTLQPVARQPVATAVAANAPQVTSGTVLQPAGTEVAAAVPAATLTAAAEPKVSPVTADLPQTAPTPTQAPAAIQIASNAPQLTTALPRQPNAAPAGALALTLAASPAQEVQAPRLSETAPDVTASKAVLAFPSGGAVDPVSLAAFQSFTSPDATTGTDLRDSLGSALSIPCARMQVTFDPDTATLRLNGHVPDAAQRAPVLAALQAQMGSDIDVTDNLLILPAPQCGALTGIADVGLPQSTDQITNPLIVGNDTHARAFRYVEGQPLVLDLTAPDYAAYVYVDYFDAEGNVIHLAPNDLTPLQRAAPKSALRIGARSTDEPGLFVRIGPPYGQEIAAAFAASVPLYEGTRPLVEPAPAYLDWLKQRVAQARAEHPDFKGEWVYFFVTTAEN